MFFKCIHVKQLQITFTFDSLACPLKLVIIYADLIGIENNIKRELWTIVIWLRVQLKMSYKIQYILKMCCLYKNLHDYCESSRTWLVTAIILLQCTIHTVRHFLIWISNSEHVLLFYLIPTFFIVTGYFTLKCETWIYHCSECSQTGNLRLHQFRRSKTTVRKSIFKKRKILNI